MAKLPSKKDQFTGWTNHDNGAYYESIPIETFQSFAVAGGFENGCDIDIIYNEIKNAQSILEVGAGYGRVLDNLIKRQYSGELFAIERSKKMHRHLTKKFSNQANIINADINSYEPERKFDVILWMWSNISEFPKHHQLAMLKKLSHWLTKDGKFILDTISHKIKLAENFLTQDQWYIAECNFGTAYGYIPSLEEIAEYGNKLKFQNIKHIPYITDTNRNRIIHIFKNLLR